MDLARRRPQQLRVVDRLQLAHKEFSPASRQPSLAPGGNPPASETFPRGNRQDWVCPPGPTPLDSPHSDVDVRYAAELTAEMLDRC